MLTVPVFSQFNNYQCHFLSWLPLTQKPLSLTPPLILLFNLLRNLFSIYMANIFVVYEHKSLMTNKSSWGEGGGGGGG